MASEVISINIKCGGCKRTQVVKGLTLRTEGAYTCGGCEEAGYSDYCYTCMCESGHSVIEFICPSCNFYEDIHIES